MIYDRDSFLAGISVGVQLKGWAAYPTGSAERKYAAGAINLLPIIPVEYEVTDVRTYATGAINLLHIIPVEYEVIE